MARLYLFLFDDILLIINEKKNISKKYQKTLARLKKGCTFAAVFGLTEEEKKVG